MYSPPASNKDTAASSNSGTPKRNHRTKRHPRNGTILNKCAYIQYNIDVVIPGSLTVTFRFPCVTLLTLFFAIVVSAMSMANAIVARIAARTEKTRAIADARRAGRQRSIRAKTNARKARPHAKWSISSKLWET